MSVPVTIPQIKNVQTPIDVIQQLQNLRDMRTQQQLTQAQTQNQLAQAQLRGQPQMTPAQNAIETYLSSFQQDPNSARTKLLGLAARKSVVGSGGTSITTPDGTQVQMGGQAGGFPTFNAPSNPNQPLSPDQSALSALFPPADPNAAQAVPGIGGGRKNAGLSLVDPHTGAVTSTPTSQVASFNQQQIEGAQKVVNLIPSLMSNVGSYVGARGEAQLVKDNVLNIVSPDPERSSRLSNYANYRTMLKLMAADMVRSATGKSPTREESEAMERKLESKVGETTESYRKRLVNDLPSLMQEFSAPAAQAQRTGLPIGNIQAPTVFGQSPVQSQQPAQGTFFSSALNGPISQQEINNLASKNNLTVAQVKKQLGVK